MLGKFTYQTFHGRLLRAGTVLDAGTSRIRQHTCPQASQQFKKKDGDNTVRSEAGPGVAKTNRRKKNKVRD